MAWDWKRRVVLLAMTSPMARALKRSRTTAGRKKCSLRGMDSRLKLGSGVGRLRGTREWPSLCSKA